jgi:SAM-dependent methyltransferase
MAAGRHRPETQAHELAYWEGRGLRDWASLERRYDALFPLGSLDFRRERVLDVGSGPLSIFERFAPAGADVTPFDTLAASYNRLVPDKKFAVRDTIPDGEFSLIVLFNMIDHMDDPAGLLDDLRSRLAANGRLWLWVHLDRPYSPEEHPQEFRFWQIPALLHRSFDVARCGLVRAGPLFPYAFWSVCHPRSDGRARDLRLLSSVTRVGMQYGWFHAVRGAVKGAKLLGLRRFLPPALRF